MEFTNMVLRLFFFALALLQTSNISVNGQSFFSSILNQLSSSSDNQTPPSPCPNTFQYKYGSNGWYGQLSISPIYGRDSNGGMIPINLDVQLSLPTTLPTRYVGKLQLIEGNDVVWQKIRNGNPNNPITYQVLFPLTSPLPSLTKVAVNNNLLCSGTVEDIIKQTGQFTERNCTVEGRNMVVLAKKNNHVPAFYCAVPLCELSRLLDNAFLEGEIRITIPGRVMTTINLTHKFYPYSVPINNRPNVPINAPIRPQIETQNVNRPAEAPVDNFANFNPEVLSPQITTSTTPRPPIVSSQQPTTPTANFNNQPSLPTSPQGSQGKCGKPLASNFLIVSGEAVTRRGEWPWMVALFHNLNEGVGIKFNCGGTLISRYYVLTAAHCTEYGGKRLETDKFLLYLGKFNLNKWSEPGSQTSEVKNVYVHPDYQSTADADIAILELSIRAEFSPYIQPACVWPSYRSDLDLIVGKLGIVAGWGRDENNKIASSVPKTVKMPIVSQEECLRSGQSYTLLTSTRTFCAGYRNGSAPCNGDSGGGFMIPMPDDEWGGTKWYIRGVVSTSLFGSVSLPCDVDNYVIFTDVAKHGSWISQFTGA